MSPFNDHLERRATKGPGEVAVSESEDKNFLLEAWQDLLCEVLERPGTDRGVALDSARHV